MSRTIRYEAVDGTTPAPHCRGRGHCRVYDVLGQQVEVLVDCGGEVYWRYARQKNWLLAADNFDGFSQYFQTFLLWAGGVK